LYEETIQQVVKVMLVISRGTARSPVSWTMPRFAVKGS